MDSHPEAGRRAALLLGGLAVPAAAGAQPRQRGPAVWLDMDQVELDAAYNQADYAPNIQQVLGRYATNSAAARQALGEPRRLAYGDAAIEQLDLHGAGTGAAPVVIFVHGGAWRAGLARDYAFPAEPFVRAGARFVVPDFSWVQDRGGDLMPLADQVRRAVAWVWRNAAGFGGDPARIHIAGHSSGAHLAAVALTTDWGALGLPADVLKSGLLISGPYDLKAARLSARSRYIAFTDAMEEALSPQRHVARLTAPLVLGYGSLETPEFQRLSRDFAAAATAAGKPARLLRGEGYNHFEIAETLANPYGLMGRAALELFGLRAPA
jgi:arylformamidase